MELFRVILVTNDSQKKYLRRLENAQSFKDMYLGKGPLGRIVTAMNYTQKAEVFSNACDIPTFLLNLSVSS